MTMTNTQMLVNSLDRSMMENLRVYRNGGIGSEHNYIVLNHEGQDAYEVSTEEGRIVGCTCGHAHFRSQVCKHQLKVSFKYGLDIKQLNK